MDLCEFTADLSAYHDGELPDPRRAEIGRHLAAGCAPCATELRRLRRLSELLAAGAPPARLPFESLQRLYALAPRVTESGFIRLAEWATGIAAAVLLGGSLWIVTHQSIAPAPPAEASSRAWVTVALSGSAENADAPTDLPTYANQVADENSPGDRP